ncbi:uncharacterized protein FOMMEDRAFT_141151 [Fomitiporia mediterranea MF3/22]|uniref:uncharacterized protein n=1 Tax=Fomitiporia mediterranea (strain MF3/22) TaxID=694068 RepID=UPI0004408A28|nr:uncharacterized protein FOMMEDRAFT_141151 [Fomitiporia mediterranea MF3/22]EJD01934.1 hypothetical protein FOMMEDRAFT_141151 [Fomitiporia mediterranea MF3/22]
MTKHSKNNTSSSVFSYHEYKKLDYGTKRQRLGNESMRPYDACALCLQKARDAVACSEGHLFCKECVYSDLLTQKKDIKRQKARLDALKKEAEEERTRVKAEARARVLQEFERGQLGLGLGIAAGAAISVNGTGKEKSKEKEEGSKEAGKENGKHDESSEPRGTKRKASTLFDPVQIETLATEAEVAALERIKREQAEALKAKLPDFWLPSLTPTYSSGRGSVPKDLKEVKVVSSCRGGQEAHEISLKSLVPVTFTYPKELPPDVRNPADRHDAICPSCKKGFSNSTIMFLMTSCSHVVCKTCTDTLVRPAAQCVVCDSPTPKDKIVEMKREGTGYAGGGLAETSKAGVAFQG